MPTEYVPVNFLIKLRDQAIELYQKTPNALEVPTIKYSRGYDAFYESFTKEVRGSVKEPGWVPRFLNGVTEAEMIGAKLYNFNFSQAILSDIYQYVNGEPLTTEMCELERQQIKWEPREEILRANQFKDLEFPTKSGLKVSCATPNLKWTEYYLNSILTVSSYKNKSEIHNSFRYLLCTQNGNARFTAIKHRIKDFETKNGVTCDIEIKKVETLFNGIIPELAGLAFPLVEDMVIYNDIPEDLKNVFKGDAVLVRGTIEMEDDVQRSYSDFILSDGQLFAWTAWFDIIWNKLKSTENA